MKICMNFLTIILHGRNGSEGKDAQCGKYAQSYYLWNHSTFWVVQGVIRISSLSTPFPATGKSQFKRIRNLLHDVYFTTFFFQRLGTVKINASK